MVHNLRNTSHVADATKLFKRQVLKRYDGEQSHLGKLIYTADQGEGVPPVHHIGLCHEFSKAGDEFNAKNREYLLQSALVLMRVSVCRYLFLAAKLRGFQPREDCEKVLDE